MTSKRIDWVDTAKGLCFLCVIFSHIETSTSLFTNFITPFFLVVFFFCAGYCYKHKLLFKSFLYRKFRKLFIPWFVFSYANIGLSYIKSFKPHISIRDELIRNALQIRGYDDKLWFIAAIFVCYIPFYFVINYTEKNKSQKKIVLFILTALYFLRELYCDFLPSNTFTWGSSSLPWHIEYIPKGVFFMYLGYYYKTDLQDRLFRFNNTFYFILISFTYILLVCCNTVNCYYLSIILKIVEHIVGVFFIVMLSKRIKINSYLRFIGSNTLVYFGIHNKVSTIIEISFEKLLGQNLFCIIKLNEIYSNIYALFLTILVSILLIVPTMMINKFCPRTLGKNV